VDPLRCQNSVGVLSVRDRIVRSRRSKHWTAASWWTRLPANSKSLLVMVPWGLPQLTSDAVMSGGKGARQTIGGAGCAESSVGDQARATAVGPGRRTPPMPLPAASWALVTVGESGTSS
jgi:hypothetical protein